jgi:hypothetical protein
MAKCPAHDDGSPSLSIRELEDGRVLIYDFGGCGSSEVLDSLGLQLSDLYADKLTHHAPPLAGGFTHEELLMSIKHETFVALLLFREARESVLTPLAMDRLERACRRISTTVQLTRRD